MNKPILNRLSGLETEFAIHRNQNTRSVKGSVKNWIDAQLGYNSSSDHQEIFDKILAHFQETTPTALPERPDFKKGAFLANGGAVWYEAMSPQAKEALFETATPECAGPKQVVAANRGLESLLVKATAKINKQSESPDAHFRLIKNCVDQAGTSYGAQENYEVEMIDPKGRESWEKKIKFLKAVTTVTLGAIPVVMMVAPLLLCTLDFGGTVPLVLMLIAGLFLFSFSKVRSFFLRSFLAVLLVPKSIFVSLAYRRSLMGKTYRKLTPFLVSRIVFAGAGGLDHKNRFVMGQKAATRDTDWLVGIVCFQNAIFCMNQLFKDLARSATEGGDRSFFKGRQRMSIAIGDSNMCQAAEYLRVATTTLVIDAIEGGAITEFPELKSTIKSLHNLNQDPEMQVSVSTTRGKMTAIEIQQFYLNACRRYVESLDNPPEEAHEILSRWSQVLRQLKTDPESLFGQVDWITKRAIMRRCVEAANENVNPGFGTTNEFKRSKSLAALKKADVKYHELTSEGYYYRLFGEDLTEPVLEDGVLEKAERMPPLANPAAQRCRYIREFTDEIEWVRWDAVKLKDRIHPIEFSCDSDAE